MYNLLKQIWGQILSIIPVICSLKIREQIFHRSGFHNYPPTSGCICLISCISIRKLNRIRSLVHRPGTMFPLTHPNQICFRMAVFPHLLIKFGQSTRLTSQQKVGKSYSSVIFMQVGDHNKIGIDLVTTGNTVPTPVPYYKGTAAIP